MLKHTLKFGIITLAFFTILSCSKSSDVAPTPSLVGVWKYKTARLPFTDAAGKVTTVDVAAKTGTGVEFKASEYVITGNNQPFTTTKSGQTQTIQIKNSTYTISTVDEIATAVAKGLGLSAADKKALDDAVAAIKKEGITHVATLDDVTIIAKDSFGTFSVGWDWYSIKEITANKLVLEIFGDESPAAERIQITLEK